MPPKSSQQEEADFIRELTKHQQAIEAFLKTLLPVHADVDALLQEVNVTMWEKRLQYEAGSNFRAWAFQIAKYHAFNERKKLQRSQFLAFDDAVMNRLIESDQVHEQEICRKHIALDHCMAMLNQKNRELIKARYTKGESLEKYAQRTGSNSGTLRATLRRVRDKLRLCITDQLQQDEA